MADELSTTEGTTQEGTPAEGERSDVTSTTQDVSAAEENFDINSVPEEYRDHVSKLEKQFKSAYTKKTQEYSDQAKQLGQYKQNEQVIVQHMKDLFSDPNKVSEKWDQYRKAYAPTLGIDLNAEVQKTREIETIEDAMSIAEERATQKAMQAFEKRLSAEREANIWDQTIDSMRADPLFKKHEKVILNLALHDPESRALYKGDKKAYLNEVVKSYKGLLKDELEAVKKETLNSFSSKKESVTSKSSVGGTSPKRTSRTREEIIAEWNNR